MLEFIDKIIKVKCDNCGKQEAASNSLGLIVFAEKGWSVFRRNEKGELIQFCDVCSMYTDPSRVEARAGVVINPMAICVV